MEKETRISFEEALDRLEKAVSRLKSGECTLEESIKIYEESVKYYDICSSILNEAKQKIEICDPVKGDVEDFKDE